MAANKFATMLHRNAHKITVILVYAVLEWVLIFLLLLNSLFSFLISKFASYFGLKPPCLWCSRVDHVLDPNKRGNSNSYRDLVCESHANEISKLGYCPSHRKLAEPRDLCKDCLSTHPNGGEKSIEISSRIAFFTWVSENRVESGENNSKCSCCDVRLSSKIYPSLLFLKPSWDALGYRAIKGDLEEEEEEEEEGEGGGRGNNRVSQIFCGEDESLNVMNLSPWISTNIDIDRLVPIELIDSSTIESQVSYISTKKEPLEKQNGSSGSEPRIDNKQVQEAKCYLAGSEVLERFEICDLVNSSILMVEQLAVTEAAQTPCTGDNNVEAAAMEEEGDETKSEIFTGMEVSNQIEAEDSTPSLPCALLDQHCINGESGTSSGPHISEINSIELDSKQTLNLSANSELSEPTCMDGLHHLHRKLQLFERRESGAEESWDGGSVISDTEGGDGALSTIEKLKSELRAQQQALSAVYAELEEERSAAAIAANQTMAMITRLQEEKSAMRTEALQYQRMMEEQSEYDQEALQLLNELMTKREKEKQELEKELEIYRKKVFDYESRESKAMMMRRKDGSARSSRNSSTDELCVDLNCGFCEHQEGGNNNTPIDTVLNLSTLDESMEGFEEERLSILEELKALEEKLFTLADEDDEEQLFEDVKPIGYFEDSGKDVVSNMLDFKAKKLLPLFDATSVVNEEGDQLNEERLDSDLIRTQNSLDSKFEVVNKKLAIEVEVDHVYERLQALETDREFLKHCIGSIKKGDKGMDLLQEILQHLRDLRSVELRARNICDSSLL